MYTQHTNMYVMSPQCNRGSTFATICSIAVYMSTLHSFLLFILLYID